VVFRGVRVREPKHAAPAGQGAVTDATGPAEPASRA
jgi:hypothetical protein